MTNKIDNLGYRTDCIARKLEGEFIERNSYAVFRMPRNPTYHWGNLLLFKDEPKEDDYEIWLSAFEYEFKDSLGHVTFGWESQHPGVTDMFVQNGFSVEKESVLILEALKRNGNPKNNLVIRKIETDGEWEAVLNLQILVSDGDNPSEGYIEFKTRLFETYRSLSNCGAGSWWGAFLGETLVGDMGLYFDDDFEMARFQSVETHPDYRKMGICSELLHSVTSQALRIYPDVMLVICAEYGSNAEGIYSKHGFKRHQVQYGLSLPHPLKSILNTSVNTTPTSQIATDPNG